MPNSKETQPAPKPEPVKEPETPKPKPETEGSTSVDLTEEEERCLAIEPGSAMNSEEARLRRSARAKIAKANGTYTTGRRTAPQPADARGSMPDPNMSPARMRAIDAAAAAPRME